jgi:hypothetical protein
MTIYLYVKTHNKTGYKYLGKTSKTDYHSYKGSGKDWLAHLKQYGNDYSTEIIKECQSKVEFNYWGRYYSQLWDVVKSPQWGNKIPETGGGNDLTEEARDKLRSYRIGKPSWNKGKPQTLESNIKRSAALKGKTRPDMTNEWKSNISAGRKGKGTGPKSDEAKRNIGIGNKGKVRPNNGVTIKGTHWYNNGIVNFRGKTCPEGFQRGRLM